MLEMIVSEWKAIPSEKLKINLYSSSSVFMNLSNGQLNFRRLEQELALFII